MDAMQQQLNKERLADATGWSVASLLDGWMRVNRLTASVCYAMRVPPGRARRPFCNNAF